MVGSKVMESKAMESRQALADGFESGLGSNLMVSKAKAWMGSNYVGSKERQWMGSKQRQWMVSKYSSAMGSKQTVTTFLNLNPSYLEHTNSDCLEI